MLIKEMENNLVEFTQELVRTKSYSGQEEKIIKLIEGKMKALGYDEVVIDSMGIPTIGFGPGEYKLAHMADENCKVSQIIEACTFYTTLINIL